MMDPKQLGNLIGWLEVQNKYRWSINPKHRPIAKLAGMMLYIDFLEYEVDYLKFDSTEKEEKIKEFKLKFEFFLLNVYPDEKRHSMFVSDFKKEEDKIGCIRKWISSLQNEILFLFTPEQIEKARKLHETQTHYGISSNIPFIKGYVEKKIREQRKFP